MHKVFLFGSMSLSVIPDVVVRHLSQIIEETDGNVEFIVGDAPGIDAAFHRALSSVGAARKTKVYCMDNPRNNRYDFDTVIIKSEYDPDTKSAIIQAPNKEPLVIDKINKIEDLIYNRSYYEFKDKQMREDCTFANMYMGRKE